jgi:predicted transcriptional regulator
VTDHTEHRKAVTVRMAPEMLAYLDTLAAAQDRDRSYLINQTLEEYVAHRRWMVEETKKAIAEADAGMFLSEEESEDFMRELDRP